MMPKDSRRLTRAEKARMWRWALIGAGLLGFVGFASGIAACLYYHLPIPPLFTTELGILLGGSLGAMAFYAFRADRSRDEYGESWY